ncbi:hypothetical protein ES705_31833 [subsurface metagenome]
MFDKEAVDAVNAAGLSIAPDKNLIIGNGYLQAVIENAAVSPLYCDQQLTGPLFVGRKDTVEKFKIDKDGNVTLAGMVDGVKISGLRCIKLYVYDATEAEKIKCQAGNIWNGDGIASTDNIAKDTTVGDFTLGPVGNLLIIESTGLTGNCVAVLSTDLIYNGCGTSLTVDALQTGGAIQISFAQEPDHSIIDLTALVDIGNIYCIIFYLTDA